LLPLWNIGHPWNAFFHFSFLILRQPVGLLGRGISPSQGRYLHRTTQTQNTQTSMPWVGFEPTIPVLERAKTVLLRLHGSKWFHLIINTSDGLYFLRISLHFLVNYGFLICLLLSHVFPIENTQHFVLQWLIVYISPMREHLHNFDIPYFMFTLNYMR
jgi:hypothetical protein